MLLGGGAALGILASCWSYVRSVWSYVSSFVVVSFEAYGSVGSAILCYCQEHGKASRFGVKSFIGCMAYVRPKGKMLSVAFECLGNGSRFFTVNWKPIWVSRFSASDSSYDMTSSIHKPVKVSFLRGTFTSRRLISDAMEFYNSTESVVHAKRHRIRHISGSAGKQNVSIGGVPGVIGMQTQPANDFSYEREYKPVLWKEGDLGPLIPKVRSIDALSLCDAMQRQVDEITSWSKSEEWHADRDIPWRLGVLLHGQPGCGKTSVVRAIAEMLDYPIYSFDLATLYNDELRREWSVMRAESPCIALFEDFDSIFDGRKPLFDITFDCVLNCLDGVDRVNGLLVFITTNVGDRIDPAIADLSSGVDVCSRPGRIDRYVHLGPLSESCRRKLANRILAGFDERIEQVVKDGDGDTGSQFQDRCVRACRELALAPTCQGILSCQTTQ